MGCEQNLRELRVNMISRLTICVKREIHELQFYLFFAILSEKLANFSEISHEISEIV